MLDERRSQSAEELWADLVLELERYCTPSDLENVTRSYLFAQRAHGEQKRKSGAPYLVHPLGVARILAGLGMDACTIMAALLHDVDEDTRVQSVHLRATFGDEVAQLVEVLTNLDSIGFRSQQHRKAESLRRLLIAMSKDLRVILIKLADRMDNMHSIDALDLKRREAFARETLEIYAPIAHRLGIYTMKWQLEDLCFRVLEPDKYALLKQKVAKKRFFREEQIQKVIELLNREFQKHGIPAEVSGRPKSLYSLWQKMKQQEKSFEEIYDVNAVRVIVNTVEECYRTLGLIHSLFRSIPNTFDDYISLPKANSYQSLHTAVIGPGKEPLEVQIRTHEMHRRAEYGVAAHWKYKEQTPSDVRFETKIAWLREVMETQEAYSDSVEFLKQVMSDLFGDAVYVQTPGGDVIELPAGSRVLDFAYRIHTEVGHHCVGAKVNGKIVPLDMALQNGDRVEILTSRSAHPSPGWLSTAKTGSARAKIRSYFRKKKLEESIESGERSLLYELTRAGFYRREDKDQALQKLLSSYHFKSREELFSKIGYGDLTASAAAAKARSFLLPSPGANGKVLARPKRGGLLRAGEGILVEGMAGIVVRISKCCRPVVGDPIIGYITSTKGIAVHHRDCQNLQISSHSEKIIAVSWEYGRHLLCPVRVHIEAEDHVGLLSEISVCVKEAQVNVQSAQVKTTEQGRALLTMVLEIENAATLAETMNKILSVKGVFKVEREFASRR